MRRCRVHGCRQHVLVDHPDAPNRCYAHQKTKLGLLTLREPNTRPRSGRAGTPPDDGWLPKARIPRRRGAA